MSNIFSWWKWGDRLKLSQVTDIAEEFGANGRSSNENGTWVKCMYFCWVLFTFNEYSEFLASLVICIHETVGLCGVWITVYCAECELLYTVQSVNYCIMCRVWITVYWAECELLYTVQSVNYCIMCRVWIIVYWAECELLYTVQSVNYCILSRVWITV